MTAATDADSAKPGSWRTSALLLLGHGSAKIAGGASLRRVQAMLQDRRLFAAVGLGLLAGDPDPRSALAGLQAERVYLVPCFVSAGYFTQVRIPAELGLSGPLTHRRDTDRPQTLCYCRPVGEHPGLAMLAQTMAARQAAAEGVRPDAATLLLVAHGNTQNPASAENARRHAAQIAAGGRFAEVAVGFLEQAPLLADALAGLRGHVVVVGLFIAEGRHGSEDLAAAIAAERARRSAREGQVINAGTVGMEPGLADLALEQARAFDRRHRC